MARWRHLLAGLAAAAWAAVAAATTLELAPSPALECLTPAGADAGAPQYPFDELKMEETGRVKVRLDFSSPDSEPEVTLVEWEGSIRFVRSVRDHVRSWRVPCMVRGQSVQLLKEFVFSKDQRRVGSPPAEDVAQELRRQTLACLTHLSGDKMPDYPRLSMNSNEQGRIHTVLTFTSPSEPPEVMTYARRSVGRLEAHVRTWVKGYRMPCLSGQPVKFAATYVFVFADARRFGLKPFVLTDLLPAVKNKRTRALALDTAEMACPFDVRFTYLQPQTRNVVGALGAWKPGREPLLEFLREIELDLPDRSIDAAYADTTTITVPCLKIDLNPQGDKQ